LMLLKDWLSQITLTKTKVETNTLFIDCMKI
jgi:hypothetical protein